MTKYPPLISDPLISRSSRPRAWTQELSYIIEEIAEQRAPNDRTRPHHEAGVSGELAVGAYVGQSFDQEIYEDYQGDGGYDLEVPIDGERYLVEVKTVYRGDLELVVDESRVEDADYFVLCRTQDPTTMVELVGWARRRELLDFGERYPDDTKIHLRPQYLFPFKPRVITAEQIRSAHSR